MHSGFRIIQIRIISQHDVMLSGLRIFQLQRNEWTTNFRRNDGNDSLFIDNRKNATQLSEHENDVIKS